ncbi:hypothetical protein [Streptomyces zagrosensis]|uniref:hypothetical protein n=1 Tax=Streptomyces zagrosensis TaxID=1042984 RepID=UPI00160B65F2
MFFQREGKRLADTMFLVFRWRVDTSRLASSAAYASRLGRSAYELWAGMDVEASGWNTSLRQLGRLRPVRPRSRHGSTWGSRTNCRADAGPCTRSQPHRGPIAVPGRF